ncbi:electron transfer DM13 [Formosa agariphila KMM 3901]|uniref:Electron transfer DM13 n=1 Tax=Formosa agariphila (strain DSM 15362 / KCTC 12365 / LMG 23005 / KMM 3901 / M-2Alg 35-1) TaxID=1347342 RepID=T2KKT0_FORAG|nr:DM13 domain-containing protein [Formosa agariphila]CDF79036.1 electron transfer DM13 [Formosa agariphila KMM 3901]
MKLKFLILLLLAMFLASCSSNDDASANNSDMEQENEEITEVVGDFVSSAHPTSGIATVSADRKTLTLTNFKSDSGPLLELYLSTNLQVEDYISLGVLKGLDGNYTYQIPNNTDIETYNYVIVWCVDFSVNFGYAVLE